MPFSVTLVTLFPEMAKAITDFGVTRRAVENGQLQLDTVNPRDSPKIVTVPWTIAPLAAAQAW